MKLNAELNGEKHEIEITCEGSMVFARVGDREYELEASLVEKDVYLFKYDNRIFEIYVAPNGIVNLGNHQLEISVTDPKRLRGSGVEGAGADGIAEIKTAMPGKLVRVLTEIGAEIKKGEGVLVVEAMKMQNEMKSPRAGVVVSVNVQPGDTVNAGDVLFVLD